MATVLLNKICGNPSEEVEKKLDADFLVESLFFVLIIIRGDLNYFIMVKLLLIHYFVVLNVIYRFWQKKRMKKEEEKT